ncbi:MAG: redox-regulated ATPase YchF [Chloroflexi bacterium]|nr:MAG: redox-regulated ATPase YchF [Chloroflexota bacterium]HDN78939.1 redox-regulated ATPase YchF [Chloroflexota bacterium]
MSLQIGIVGLPNVGKSTLFNALTRANAAVASYPFTTIEPNIGVAAVPDERLYAVAQVVNPETVTPATVEFVDIAGLVKGAHQGEGLGNRFLAHIRNVDAIAMVVRCFEAPDIPHPSGEIDPVADIEIVDVEMALADLETVEKRLSKTRSAAKSRPRDYEDVLLLLEDLHRHLAAGHRAATWQGGDEGKALVRELNLLTGKARLFVANVSEDDLPDGGELVDRVRQKAQEEGSEVVVICAPLEEELARWPEEEALAYLKELGLEEPGLNRLVRAGFHLLDLITFFTATGRREVRAWPVKRGTTVWEAAGKIHTDMQKGFVRAEVINWRDFVAAGSWAEARAKGIVRVEGRDYKVQDGDVIHIRFSH